MTIKSISSIMAVCACLVVLSVAAGCKDESSDGKASPSHADSSSGGKSAANSPSPFKIPDKYAEVFTDYRQNWVSLTGYEFSGLHWGQYISLYVNKNPDTYIKNYLEYVRLYVNQDIDEASTTEEKHFEPYPVGTIFLKENFRAEGGQPANPLTVTAMIKKEKGYDPATNDWQFIQFGTEGNILFDGNSHDAPTQMMCIKCHGNMAERDFIFSTYCSIAQKK